jgi:hypothetical protein
VACAVDGQWDRSLEAFQRAKELGHDDELLPASVLKRLELSADGSDKFYLKLMDFLIETRPDRE